MRHLAQVNVSTLRYGIDDPRLTGFELGASLVNRAAGKTPGHIWSDQQHDGGDRFITRSLWRDVESLRAFVYSGVHRRYLNRGQEWFLPAASVNLALWWVEENHRPGIEEALGKLDQLARQGPTAEVFDFSHALKAAPA